jgi:S1-C subfamily serine protease
MSTAKAGSRPYFGSIPDFGSNAKGLAISGVAKNGPASKGGITGGDVIVKLGESQISNLDDFDSALRKHKAGDKVTVVVVRGDKELTFEVELGQPRGN